MSIQTIGGFEDNLAAKGSALREVTTSSDGDKARLDVSSSVTASVLPTGAATSANQTNGTQQTKVTESALPTGASTSANQTNGNQQTKVVGVDYVDGNSGIDSATETIQQISYEHHEIHSGSHYFIQQAVDLSINNVFDMQFTTPANTKWTHFVFSLLCESETDWYIYEGASISTAGTSITPVNNDRNSDNTSGNTVAGITNTSLANANADTPVAGATLIAHGTVGAGRDGGFTDRTRELILKQNTIYCLRAVATAAGYISYNAEWYEHTNKN